MYLTHPFTAHTLSLIIATLVTFTGCYPGLFSGPGGTRTLTVRVVADPDFAGHRQWRANAENLIGTAGLFYKSWFDIELTIDTMLVWELEKSPSYSSMLDHDYLVKDVPKDGADVVIDGMEKAMDKLKLDLSYNIPELVVIGRK